MTGGASRTLEQKGSPKRELLSISQLEVALEQGGKGTCIPGILYQFCHCYRLDLLS